MGDDEKYKELREQYRSFKIKVIAADYLSNVEGLEEAVQEVPALEKQLLEFCLSNGYDLQELQKFYRAIDLDALAMGFYPG